jgi:hypothetical protein
MYYSRLSELKKFPVPLKEILSRKLWLQPRQPEHEIQAWNTWNTVIDTDHHKNYTAEYLAEFESIFEKDLAHVSGAQMELFDEKKTGGKSRDTVLLRTNL